MDRRPLLAVTLLCLLLSSFAAAHASGGIVGVSPREGTVGTQLTISGSGFGERRGEVLIGPEKCKVLAWADTEITCNVVKPQTAGAYLVTVLLQGDKKPAQPLTFTAFTVRDPRIIPADTPSGLISDGQTVTVLGDFFGDKQGDVSVADASGAIVTAKVLEWSMQSIRVEIPRTLLGATGNYLLRVENGVGDALLPVHVDAGMPGGQVGYTYIGGGANNNSGAVTYKGSCYLFTLHRNCACLDDDEIQAQTISFAWSDGLIKLTPLTSMPSGRSDAAVVPMVVEDELWVFHTGHDSHIYFTRYDGTQWGSRWFSVEVGGLPVLTRKNWEVAPVYNPLTHRLDVYYESAGKLNRVYTDNYGAAGTWVNAGEVAGVGTITTAPSVVRYVGTNWGKPYDTLLALGDSANQGKVLALADGSLVGTPLSFGSVWGRPFLEDAGDWHRQIHLIWLTAQNGNVCQKGMLKDSGAWTENDCYPAWAKIGLGTTSTWGPSLARWDSPSATGIEFQFWGSGGHWAVSVVGLPKEP